MDKNIYKKTLMAIIITIFGKSIHTVSSMESQLTLNEADHRAIIKSLDEIESKLNINSNVENLADFLITLNEIKKKYNYYNGYVTYQDRIERLRKNSMDFRKETILTCQHKEPNLLSCFSLLSKDLRSGFTPNQNRVSLVKNKMDYLIKILFLMRVTSLSRLEDKDRSIILTTLTDIMRFQRVWSREGNLFYKFLESLNPKNNPLNDSEIKNFTELLVYCDLIRSALFFKKTTMDNLNNISTRLENIWKDVSQNTLNAIKTELQKYDDHSINQLILTLPQNLQEMIKLENVERTKSPENMSYWGKYRGIYDYETQAKRLMEWRRQADQDNKKLYLIVGRTNNEIPAFEMDNIMWIYVDLDGELMNPVGAPHILWDMNQLELKDTNEEYYIPSKIFDGIILDWSTWKFFGGRSFDSGFTPSIEEAKKVINVYATEENNSISAFRRIIKEDGFLAFEQSLTDATSTSKEILDAQLNHITKHTSTGGDIYRATLSDQYTAAVFKENFKECHNISKDFATIIDGETIPPFTPEGHDTLKTTEDLDKLNVKKRKRFFARFPKNEVAK